MGKLIDESRGEVVLNAEIIEYYAKNAERVPRAAEAALKPSQGDAVVISSPLGVLFGVEPWNFPYYQLARFAAPEPYGGQCRRGETRRIVPQCAMAFEKSVAWKPARPRARIPTCSSRMIRCDRVIDDPRIKGVALTGSVEAGKSVAGRAGKKP